MVVDGNVVYNVIKNTSKIYYNGSIWKTNNCGNLIIISKVNKFKTTSSGKKKFNFYLCRFEDGYEIIKSFMDIKVGEVKNPFCPNVNNVGFIGVGRWKSRINNYPTREYSLWKSMLGRCYSEKVHSRQPLYKDCETCEEWHNYQNFCDDIQKLEGYENWKNDKDSIWQLDKDILCDKLNINPKLYSLNTCKFVTHNENTKYSCITGLIYIATRLSDNYTEEFTNQSEFCKKYNLTHSNLNTCINTNNQNTHKGWIFKIKEVDNNND